MTQHFSKLITLLYLQQQIALGNSFKQYIEYVNAQWISAHYYDDFDGEWGVPGECDGRNVSSGVSGEFGVDPSNPDDRMGLTSIRLHCSSGMPVVDSYNGGKERCQLKKLFNLFRIFKNS